MKYLLIVFMLLPILLSACQKTAVVTKDLASTTTPALESKKDNINFEVTSFAITYNDNTSVDSLYISERFSGSGLITAVGDESLVKLPYDVLIDIKKISGGSRSDSNEGSRIVIVNNGVGTFTTYDSIFEKNATRMVKPVYEIKVIGYIPYIKLNQKIKTP